MQTRAQTQELRELGMSWKWTRSTLVKNHKTNGTICFVLKYGFHRSQKRVDPLHLHLLGPIITVYYIRYPLPQSSFLVFFFLTAWLVFATIWISICFCVYLCVFKRTRVFFSFFRACKLPVSYISLLLPFLFFSMYLDIFISVGVTLCVL